MDFSKVSTIWLIFGFIAVIIDFSNPDNRKEYSSMKLIPLCLMTVGFILIGPFSFAMALLDLKDRKDKR